MKQPLNLVNCIGLLIYSLFFSTWVYFPFIVPSVLSDHSLPSDFCKSTNLKFNPSLDIARALASYPELSNPRVRALVGNKPINPNLGGSSAPLVRLVTRDNGLTYFAIQSEIFPSFSDAVTRSCQIQLESCLQIVSQQTKRFRSPPPPPNFAPPPPKFGPPPPFPVNNVGPFPVPVFNQPPLRFPPPFPFPPPPPNFAFPPPPNFPYPPPPRFAYPLPPPIFPGPFARPFPGVPFSPPFPVPFFAKRSTLTSSTNSSQSGDDTSSRINKKSKSSSKSPSPLQIHPIPNETSHSNAQSVETPTSQQLHSPNQGEWRARVSRLSRQQARNECISDNEFTCQTRLTTARLVGPSPRSRLDCISQQSTCVGTNILLSDEDTLRIYRGVDPTDPLYDIFCRI